MTRDTGPAKLPGLGLPAVPDPALARWVQAVTERLEVREGARGNPMERAVTQRELDKIAGAVMFLGSDKRDVRPGDFLLELGGGLTASVAIDRFVAAIKATQLYKDLMKRLDDPTRFDDLPEQIRGALLRSVGEEAEKRGADITRLETKIQNEISSIAFVVETVTAAVENAAAGVRDLTFASADANQAQAGKITQIESSLGNYYQDGTPGRVLLEQLLTTTANRVTGLRGQYTLKIQAGGALAGFGLAAEEVNGVPTSAFIISATKFAIVDPATYSGGLTNTPDTSVVPFGVDANGIYLNTNVYVRGNLRVDTNGRTLIQGLRGSLNIAVDGIVWSDNVARQAIWQTLGNAGLAVNNNHLVIGDAVTIYRGTTFVETRHWFGTAWIVPGAVINGNVLIDGSLAAQKIDTRGLTIKDGAGVVIFGAGVGLDAGLINGLQEEIFQPAAFWEFDGSAEGWTATAATLTASMSRLSLAPTAPDSNIISPAISVSGSEHSVVRAVINVTTLAGWEGGLYWKIGAGGFNGTQLLAIPAPPGIGRHVVEWNLSATTAWTGGTVTGIRLDIFAGVTPYTVESVAVGRYGSVGAKITPGNASTFIADAAINNAQIGNLIASNNFNGTVDASGQITAAGTTGWAIAKTGRAVFSDATLRGAIFYVDPTSGQDMQSVALATYAFANLNFINNPGYRTISLQPDGFGGQMQQTTYDNSKLIISLGGDLVFFGPQAHAQGSKRNRVRAGPVLFVASASAVVDHFFSLWYRTFNGVTGLFSAWTPMAFVTEPQNNYGSASLAFAVTVTLSATATAVEFTVAPTNANAVPLNPTSVEIRDLTVTVQGYNI